MVRFIAGLIFEQPIIGILIYFICNTTIISENESVHVEIEPAQFFLDKLNFILGMLNFILSKLNLELSNCSISVQFRIV